MGVVNRLISAAKNAPLKSVILYSFGEIILIIIGILAAFQVEKWADDRTRRQLEIQTLNEIKEGFTRDINDIQFNVELHRNAARSGKIILDHFKIDLPYKDTLAKHFSTALWYSKLIINEGPFETLKARGLDLISNKSIRESIISLYENDYKAIQAFEENVFLERQYISEVIAKRFDKTEIWKAKPNHTFVAGDMIPIDFEKLKRDQDYNHILKTLVLSNEFLIDWFMTDVIDQLHSLINDLDSEINRLNADL